MGLSESELPGQSFTGTGHRTVAIRLGRDRSGPASCLKPSFSIANIIDEGQYNSAVVEVAMRSNGKVLHKLQALPLISYDVGKLFNSSVLSLINGLIMPPYSVVVSLIQNTCENA